MSLKTIVKVSHLSNLSDARYCAGMGVDLLGFHVTEGHESYMAPETFQDIRGWISGPKIVAELYGIQSAADISRVRDTYAPDYFELTAGEYARFADDLHLPCIVAVADENDVRALPAAENIKYLLATADVPAAVRPGVNVLARVTDTNEAEARINAGYDGIAIPGPKEFQPGMTNTDELGDILEALEED